MIGLVHGNIDRTDEQLNTNAPFEYACSCRFGRIILPRSAFISIKLYIDADMALPARLSRVYSPDPASIAVEFCDAHSVLIGTWTTPLKIAAGCDYVSGFVYDSNGILRGHVVCDPSTPGTLNAACKFIGGDIKPNATDFILLRQCCVPWYTGKSKMISINGTMTSADVMLGVKRPGDGYDPGDIDDVFIWSVPVVSMDRITMRVDAFGDFDRAFLGLLTGHADDQFTVGRPGIRHFRLQEGGVSISIEDVGDASFMVRNTKLSNLRVVTTDQNISCIGVASGSTADTLSLSVMQTNATASSSGSSAPQPILQYTQATIGDSGTQSQSQPQSQSTTGTRVNIVTPSRDTWAYTQFMRQFHE